MDGIVKEVLTVGGWVLFIVVTMAKHFKAINEALPSIRKFFTYVHRKWFSNAIFRADVLKYMDNNQLHNNKVEKELQAIRGEIGEMKAELKTNGGNSVKDLVATTVKEVKHLRGLRDISDKFDTVMKFKYDPEQGVTFINEAFLKAFGCREADVLWYAYTELLHPEDVADMRGKWDKAIETATPFKDVQRIRDSAGQYRTCEVKAVPIEIKGVIVEFSGVIEPIKT